VLQLWNREPFERADLFELRNRAAPGPTRSAGAASGRAVSVGGASRRRPSPTHPSERGGDAEMVRMVRHAVLHTAAPNDMATSRLPAAR
jgi:hypothetical protein